MKVRWKPTIRIVADNNKHYIYTNTSSPWPGITSAECLHVVLCTISKYTMNQVQLFKNTRGKWMFPTNRKTNCVIPDMIPTKPTTANISCGWACLQRCETGTEFIRVINHISVQRWTAWIAYSCESLLLQRPARCAQDNRVTFSRVLSTAMYLIPKWHLPLRRRRALRQSTVR